MRDGETMLANRDRSVHDVEVVFSASQLTTRISSLARQIADAPWSGDLLVVAILKGSFMFASDLLRALHASGLAPEVDFLSLSSYGSSTKSSGQVRIVRDVEIPAAGRQILLVDDILESGRTLDFARRLLLERGAAGVRSCVLLSKQVPRACAIEAEIVAFACPDEFVVGYGMDLANRYRQLPFVGRLSPQSTPGKG